MIIAEHILKPFGYIGIPKILMVRQSSNPALLARLYRACEKSEKDAEERWEVINRARKLGIKLTPLQETDYIRLRVVYAGGQDVECTITPIMVRGKDIGFFMDTTFSIPGSSSRYGSMHEYINED